MGVPLGCKDRASARGSGRRQRHTAAEQRRFGNFARRAEDLDIDLENNVPTIRGEKREERTRGDEQGTYHLAGWRYGQFSRSFDLPRDVDAEAIEASFEDGVQTVGGRTK